MCASHDLHKAFYCAAAHIRLDPAEHYNRKKKVHPLSTRSCSPPPHRSSFGRRVGISYMPLSPAPWKAHCRKLCSTPEAWLVPLTKLTSSVAVRATSWPFFLLYEFCKTHSRTKHTSCLLGKFLLESNEAPNPSARYALVASKHHSVCSFKKLPSFSVCVLE